MSLALLKGADGLFQPGIQVLADLHRSPTKVLTSSSSRQSCRVDGNVQAVGNIDLYAAFRSIEIWRTEGGCTNWARGMGFSKTASASGSIFRAASASPDTTMTDSRGSALLQDRHQHWPGSVDWNGIS